jgi:uncharacterized circularly permuted ATP-grasp superfamily protein/uncharacterized alpha-E superfamily protein
MSVSEQYAVTDAVRSLLASYAAQSGSFDELLKPDGSIRPGWLPILEEFARMSPESRQELKDTAERMLRDNGVTFVASEEAGSHVRPWQLDMLPVLISPEEWQELEAGLMQRARLLNQLLVDLYGPQRALADGLLPPSVVFGNRQFLRPCANVPVAEDRYLQFLAFDVARSPDGRWWVLSDRTEAPAGAGFALENRVVSSRCLPELFSSLYVRRQASFFRAFNDHFLAQGHRDDPLAVYLSRGPSKNTYFEHAYLARYLGYNVVEGSDLTVRDDRVFVKTVGGLRPVDLVLRTIRSEMCDPLELRSDSLIGIPGLLQAARAGRVKIANALGSGLVESDAFLSFLGSLSQYYLSEELLLPSVATWWCGQARERDYVLANLDRLIVRRISTTRSLLVAGKDGRVADQQQFVDRAELAEQIRRAGHDFIGQEPLAASSSPMLGEDDMLRAAPFVVRFYVAATDDGYRVMPGGLARASDVLGRTRRGFAEGEISKDTWVLSHEPVDGFSLLAQRQTDARLRRGGRDLPSRSADNLFWLGRYAERAEAAVRLLRSLVMRLHGEVGATRLPVSLDRVVTLLVANKHLPARRGRRVAQSGRDAVQSELWSILFDSDSRDGLATVLGNVRRTAEVVRERLSYDAYLTLTELANAPGDWSLGARRDTEAALRLLNRLTQYLAAFSGMAMENMTRGYGWRFLDMGRRIERIKTMTLLVKQLVVYGDPEGDGGLDLLLELADSTMTYRNRYHAPAQITRVLDLLLADESNPRSIIFQANTINEHLVDLPHVDRDGLKTDDQRVARQLANEILIADMEKLAGSVSRNGARARLDRLTRRIEQDVVGLSNLISHHFFSHSIATRVSGSPGIQIDA